MRYATVCSGIEAPTHAWRGLGWTPLWFSEVDPFCNALLKHYYPEVPNLGDMRFIYEKEKAGFDPNIELICGGTPCQSFSAAGDRGGLDDDRGQLAIEYCRLIGVCKPRWVIWENVPGVLSSWTDGEIDEKERIRQKNDLDTIIHILRELGYGICLRILDSQHWGVPQQRRRVFLVGYLGDWRPAGAVLFEPESHTWNITEVKKKGSIASAVTASGVGVSGITDRDAHANHIVMGRIAQTIGANYGKHYGCSGQDQENGFSHIVMSNVARTLNAGGERRLDGDSQNFIFQSTASSTQSLGISTISPTLSKSDKGTAVFGTKTNFRPRRLTPLEFERLQGFDDNYTAIPYRGRIAKDMPRYQAIGNSMPVPVIRWIGQRINFINKIMINEKENR